MKRSEMQRAMADWALTNMHKTGSMIMFIKKTIGLLIHGKTSKSLNQQQNKTNNIITKFNIII